MRKAIVASLLAGFLFSTVSPAFADCYSECWYDSWGNRHCRTSCRPHPRPDVDAEKGLLALSASFLALSVTTLAIDHDKQILVQAAEDAAAYFETAKLTGTLGALVQLAREEAAKMSSVQRASELTEAELVDGILRAAEEALESN